MPEEDRVAAATSLPVTLLSPDRTVFEGRATHVLARGSLGAFEILPGHEPLMTPLAVGLMELTTEEGTKTFAVHGGFLEMDGASLTVLADAAERGDEIDTDRATAAEQRAQERLETAAEARDDHDTDVTRARSAIARATTRLQASERVHE